MNKELSGIDAIIADENLSAKHGFYEEKCIECGETKQCFYTMHGPLCKRCSPGWKKPKYVTYEQARRR